MKDSQVIELKLDDLIILNRRKNEIKKNNHNHFLKKAVIPPSFAVHNTRLYKVCFGCGLMKSVSNL